MIMKEFSTYERLIEHIEGETRVCLPSLPAGKVAFFKKMGIWLHSPESKPSPRLFILPDPSSNLAFPTPFEELSSALFITTRISPNKNAITNLLNEYGLPSSKLNQPISSLSGGERLLLSFAKAHALLPIVEGLIIANPTQWLNSSRYHLLQKLYDRYQNSGKTVLIAAIEGEDIPLNSIPMANNLYENIILKKYIPWELELTNLNVTFEETTFPTYHSAFSLNFINNIDGSSETQIIRMKSPTLITGDNGSGKSTFGKLLSGIISPSAGIFQLRGGGSNGTARILLQECVEQLFGKSAIEHIDWAFRFDKVRHADAMKIYEILDGTLRNIVTSTEDLPQDLVGSSITPDTLLQGKIALVAERLAAKPPLMILDEPGWGLTPRISIPFVTQICEIAHERGTAIAIISHQNKIWEILTKSLIHLEHSSIGTIIHFSPLR
jgi:ABC-type multidrug transport system ATPase subunit